MQTVYIIMSCNQWKENASARMIAATTDEKTMYAVIGGEIRAGNMDYDGETATVGFMKFKEDYVKGEVNLSKLDYCMVLETCNAQSNEPESLPKNCAGIPRLLIKNEPSPEPDIELLKGKGNRMSTMMRFENVNIIEALRKIMLHNTEHYQSDSEYDIKSLQEAAEDSEGSRHFLWLSRGCGTWCFEERDVYIRNTHAFNTWDYYNNSSENVKAFAVEIERLQNKAVIGHIFELDYRAHIEDVRKNCLNAQAVEVVFKHPDSSNGYIRRFDIDEYNNNWYTIGQRYGEIETLRYQVSDEFKLQTILNRARQARILESAAGNLEQCVGAMVKERFHAYGYTCDDMVFATPRDAFDALERKVPIYMLTRDNSCEPAISTDEISYHTLHKGIFGMAAEDKRLLEYLLALPENRAELFNGTELQQIYSLALAAGQSGETNKAALKTVETIVHKLDRVLPYLPDVEENVQELDKEMEV